MIDWRMCINGEGRFQGILGGYCWLVGTTAGAQAERCLAARLLQSGQASLLVRIDLMVAIGFGFKGTWTVGQLTR